MRIYRTCPVSELPNLRKSSRAVVGAIVSGCRIVTPSKGRNAGQRMAILTLQDRMSSIEGVLFPDAFRKCGELATIDQVVFAVGEVGDRNGEMQMVIDQLIAPEDAPRLLTDRIEVDLGAVDGKEERELRNRFGVAAGLLRQSGGTRLADGARPAEVFLRMDNGKQSVMLRSNMRIVPHSELLGQLQGLLGGDRIRLVGRVPEGEPRNKRRRY